MELRDQCARRGGSKRSTGGGVKGQRGSRELAVIKKKEEVGTV